MTHINMETVSGLVDAMTHSNTNEQWA